MRQYAESLFLRRELFATTNRTGILLLVSRFERRIILVPDKGIESCFPQNVLQKIIEAMTHPLKQKDLAKALETGLAQLSQYLESFALSFGSKKDELPNQIIEEKGA